MTAMQLRTAAELAADIARLEKIVATDRATLADAEALMAARDELAMIRRARDGYGMPAA